MRTRIRSVKPEFFTDADLFIAERDSGLPLRVAFAGLWCCSDRAGRFEWKPMELGAHVLPYDGIDFSRVLDALATRGFLVRYASGDREYGCIPTFIGHQSPNVREAPSILPDPPVSPRPRKTSTRAPRVPDACPTRDIPARVEPSRAEPNGTEPEPFVAVVPATDETTTGLALVVSEKPSSKTTWLTPFIEAWITAYGGKPPAGQLAKALDPLVKAQGAEPILVLWGHYLAQTEARFASPQRFAATAASWTDDWAKAAPKTQRQRNEAVLKALREEAANGD